MVNTDKNTAQQTDNAVNTIGKLVKFEPENILRPNRSKSFKCGNGHFITLEAYDTKRTETIHFPEIDERSPITRDITETNYKIFVRKEDSGKALQKIEKEDGIDSVTHEAIYQTNVPSAFYNIPKVIADISNDLKQYNITIPEEKIIDFIKEDQKRVTREYPSNEVGRVARYSFATPKSAQATLQ